MFLNDFIRSILDLLPVAPSLLPFFVAVHFQHMELERAYKKEVRLAYAARQLPYVGTLLTKKGKDSEGAEVVLNTLVKF